ncbi:site-specific integrase [Bradyrhizobium sp. INPA01-394B]|jgi:integrase|uniref:Site-specific integrase n=1 Tax=Bradyrhizobium campsiandrae TaxID=1729892 RepID=A0ABR7UEC6_9BRAD|nr:site-specific integrase [Bradyrhizobium campsiandrae]MBC9880705.1 site-specific integrase [Bradyrhizobium campsiandrae]MBC9982222.1 site-specific integrase [Bradyrhizobium campsiandrae]
MAKIKITKRSVETLKVTSKDYIAFDTELPGFGVRVMPSGKRFFLVQYRRHGRTRRVMIGQFGVVTAELARREATIKLGSVRGANGDPAALRDAERQSLTMKQLGERFLTQYVPARCKPSTEAEYRRAVELFLDPFFAKQHVRSVTTADVAELHGSLSHIPYQANRTLGVLSKMMNLAETWGIRDKHTNPCEDVERYPERKRERFLSPKELKRLGHALAAAEAEQTETKYAVAAFRILLLTGCRLSEIQKLEWRYVDLEQKELRLPDSKTGAKTVHLGDAAVALLKALPHLTGNPYVIVGKKKKTHLTDLQHPWRRIRKAAKLNDVRIHDLRHTFASGGLLVGEGLAMIGKLLGHTQVQTTARYAHLASDPVKQAATKISDRLAAALFDTIDNPSNNEPQQSHALVSDVEDRSEAA